MRRPGLLLSVLLLVSALAAACGGPAAPADPTATPTPAPLVAAATPTAAPDEPPATPTDFPAPDNTRPPTAELIVAGQAQTSAIGTYCWTNLNSGNGVGLCVDMLGINTPQEPLLLPSGPFTAQFALPLDDAPTSTALYVYPAPGQPAIYTDTHTLGWMPPNGENQLATPLTVSPTVDLDLADGLYVVALFAQWQDLGDVMYGYLVQVGEIPATPEPSGELPAACVPAGDAETAFVDPAGRYCLLYPSTFRTGDLTDDRANFYGPPLDESIEPVFAALSIAVLGPDDGRALSAVVADYVAENGGGLPIDRQPAQWGGEPAELLNGLPGRQATRQLIVLHAGTVYHVVLMPYDVNDLPALPDVENVWATASQSFTFLPAP